MPKGVDAQAAQSEPIDFQRGDITMAMSCPEREKLVRLGTPAIGDETFQAYDEHVQSCPNCKAALQGFVAHGFDSAALAAPPAAGAMSYLTFPDSRSSTSWDVARWGWFTWQSKPASTARLP